MYVYVFLYLYIYIYLFIYIYIFCLLYFYIFIYIYIVQVVVNNGQSLMFNDSIMITDDYPPVMTDIAIEAMAHRVSEFSQ